ncbi:hypothetical protein SASPL_150018 [Salvia splendens]|uniref:Vacuolar iron transporter n=1 Tax=Salvia splendens TaxID=180675 RepID=A0A8X8Z1M2_SALSN|nr:hypothetical protein SASPL_150018 [Salvia splendens]
MASNPIQNPNSSILEQEFDYSKRSQWLRAAVLGANDGLVSTASLMMGVGAVKHAIKAMVLAGFAGLVAGACSMAIGEFVSVYSQLDIELAQLKRDEKRSGVVASEEEKREGNLPNPIQAAAASALAFSVGAMVPLLAASFIEEYRVRVGGGGGGGERGAGGVRVGGGGAGEGAGGEGHGEGAGRRVAGDGVDVWFDQVDWIKRVVNSSKLL